MVRWRSCGLLRGFRCPRLSIFLEPSWSSAQQASHGEQAGALHASTVSVAIPVLVWRGPTVRSAPTVGNAVRRVRRAGSGHIVMLANVRRRGHRETAPVRRTPRLAGDRVVLPSLRAAITSLTPLLSRISGDLNFGTTITGAFGMLLTVMFALAGFVAPRWGAGSVWKS